MERKRMKIILFSILAIVLFSGSVIASWIYFLPEANVFGSVISDASSDVLVWTTQSDTFGVVDATNDAISINATLIFENNNNVIEDMTITINENIVDVNSDSCDNTGDLNTTWTLDSQIIRDNDVLDINPGQHIIVVSNNYVKGSCPAFYNATIGLTQ